ncbi:hypothetical protein ACCC92_02995 [Mucilaginibacter sp. Mucisp84]|uniref:hypothetical protein n=1 Tax=Mucilaginibacter sp. Mucisp84 TaxID=3243058 RepID=UPI0039A51113
MEQENPSYQKYFWTTLWVMVGVILGLLFILIYHLCDESIHIGSALVWAGAFFIAGALAGFIFGVPKIVSSNTNASAGAIVPQGPPAPASPVAEGDAKPLAATVTPAANNLTRKIIQENTNLTQVSDWLTKVIIGAGLVQLKEIPGFVLKVATKMGYGITLHPQKLSTADPAIILCAGILIYFLTWGFASGYLIMRLIIAELLAEAE